ncbi:unnamed protein product [Amoebophrya sp. A25]|nr:unnamed protein product [Amoebophrya sp. A25]|eukprot:GSA25T00018550001.1
MLKQLCHTCPRTSASSCTLSGVRQLMELSRTVSSSSSSSNSRNACSVFPNRNACAGPKSWSDAYSARASRGFATITDVEASKGAGKRPLETWEEIDQHYVKAPSLENYKRPKNAPLPTDLKRSDYHQFMRGKPSRWQRQLIGPAVGSALFCFCVCEFAYAMFKLKPDDFEWIEEERARAKAARGILDIQMLKNEKLREQKAVMLSSGGGVPVGEEA